MSSTRRDSGFTLIEILMVVFLIGVVTFALAPRVTKPLNFALRGATQEMEAELRASCERAVATGVPQRLAFDLDGQRFRLEHYVDTREEQETDEQAAGNGRLDLRPPLPEREFEPVPIARGEWRRLDTDDVLISRIRIGDEVFDKQGVGIVFQTDGSADDAEVELEDASGRTRVLRILPFTGEVEILEGEKRG